MVQLIAYGALNMNTYVFFGNFAIDAQYVNRMVDGFDVLNTTTGSNIHVTGDNFNYGSSIDLPRSGAVTAIGYFHTGSPYISITGLGLDMAQFRPVARSPDVDDDARLIRNILNGDDAIIADPNSFDSHTLVGFDGDDTLYAGAGDDKFSGGTGIDTADYHALTTALNLDLLKGLQLPGAALGDEFFSIERFVGSASDDIMKGRNTGANAADVFDGHIGNDMLYGRGGNDSLTGSFGDDTLVGGKGIDRVFGGPGSDTIVLDPKSHDVIRLFHRSEDTIALPQNLFTNLHESKNHLVFGEFVAGRAARDADDFIIYDKDQGRLYYDADGSGTQFGNTLIASLDAGIGLLTALNIDLI